MKVITSVTVHHKADAKSELEVLAPGEHDLPDDVAKGLIARGQAESAAKAKAKADADVGGVQVKTEGKGPKVEQK